MRRTLIIACTLLVMVSCKKDVSTNPSTKNPESEREVSEVQGNILYFLETIKNHENGHKSDETMNYDEAILLWENTLNYCHSFTCTPMENMQYDTICMKVDGINNNLINTSDAVEIYNNLIDEVREVYTNTLIENKKLHYVMVDKHNSNGEKNSENEIYVVVMTGSETIQDTDTIGGTPWYGIPFNYTQSFHSAFFAQVLENAIKNYDESHQIIINPGPNMTTIVHSLTLENRYDIYCCNWVYNGTNDSILPYYVANQLYADAMIHTHTEDMVIGDYGNLAYFETLVIGKKGSERNSWSHQIDVYHAIREWRYDYASEEEYPIDIDEENPS